MDTTECYPDESGTVPLIPQHLELAPEGWRACAQQIAQGFTFMKAGEVFCDICGRQLDRGHGHDVMCLTLYARRMIDEEPRLHASLTQEALALTLFVQDADIDKVHASRLPVDLVKPGNPVPQDHTSAGPRAANAALKRPWQTEGLGHFAYIQTICDAYESGMGDALAGMPPQNPYRCPDNPDRHAAYKAGHEVGAQIAENYDGGKSSDAAAKGAAPRLQYLAARAAVIKLMHGRGMSDKAIADVLATTVEQVRVIRTTFFDDSAMAAQGTAKGDAATTASPDDLLHAGWYRLLRDARKLPADVWGALEFGEGLDSAMERFAVLHTPIAPCEPCKAGRYADCRCAVPCSIPVKDATN